MIPLNTQPIERQEIRDVLNVHSVFPTIQGEGPFVGRPSVFIRLAGCNLRCTGCDTDYTSHRQDGTPDAIVKHVREFRTGGLVVITGGEPFRQNIGPLCSKLLWSGYEVQIETNGTLWLPDVPYPNITVVCSPKTPLLNKELAKVVDCYKYVVEEGYIAEDGLPTRVLGMDCYAARPPERFPRENIFIQPADEGDAKRNKENEKAAVQSCLRHGYTMGIQLHKLLGLS